MNQSTQAGIENKKPPLRAGAGRQTKRGIHTAPNVQIRIPPSDGLEVSINSAGLILLRQDQFPGEVIQIALNAHEARHLARALPTMISAAERVPPPRSTVELKGLE